MSLAEDQKVVVKAINRLRAKAGLPKINKLKKGVPKHPGACPIAMSLAETGVARVYLSGYSVDLRLPRFVPWTNIGLTNNEISAITRVIGAFDHGDLPELEIPKTPVKIKYPGDRKSTVIA